jgi:hypothetical protein
VDGKIKLCVFCVLGGRKNNKKQITNHKIQIKNLKMETSLRNSAIQIPKKQITNYK